MATSLALLVHIFPPPKPNGAPRRVVEGSALWSPNESAAERSEFGLSYQHGVFVHWFDMKKISAGEKVSQDWWKGILFTLRKGIPRPNFHNSWKLLTFTWLVDHQTGYVDMLVNLMAPYFSNPQQCIWFHFVIILSYSWYNLHHYAIDHPYRSHKCKKKSKTCKNSTQKTWFVFFFPRRFNPLKNGFPRSRHTCQAAKCSFFRAMASWRSSKTFKTSSWHAKIIAAKHSKLVKLVVCWFFVHIFQ